MTRTMLRVVLALLFLGMCSTSTAGARNDYEECAGNYTTCEAQRLEGASPNSLVTTICYETAQVCAIKAQAVAHVEPILDDVPNTLDFREEKIREFFIRNNSPGAKYAKLFVQVADANHIDWRLLPIFSMIETGGGRVHINNNIFGWDCGRTKFRTIADGIRYVGKALTLGPYKDKAARDKIRVYNTHARYHRLADKLMELLNGIET